MRRPVAVLLAGTALMATAMIPVAAGADPAPFTDKQTKARLHLTCRVAQKADHPSVGCEWEQRPARRPMPEGVRYRLWRLGKAEHRRAHVVYRGRAMSFVDTGVSAGHGYLYRVQVVDSDGDAVGRSNVAAVRVRRAQPESNPPCEDQYSTASRIPAGECSRPETAPEPTSKPTHPDKPATPAGPPSAETPKDTPSSKPLNPGKPADKPSDKPSGKPEDKPSGKPEDKPDRPVFPQPDHPGKPAHPDKPAADKEKGQDRPAAKPAERSSAGSRPDHRPVAQMQLACEPMPAAAPQAEAVAVTCSWTPVEGAAGYRLGRAERGDQKVAFDTKEATSYLDRDVESGHGYLYVVEALDADGGVIGRSHPVPANLRPAEAKRGTHQGS